MIRCVCRKGSLVGGAAEAEGAAATVARPRVGMGADALGVTWVAGEPRAVARVEWMAASGAAAAAAGDGVAGWVAAVAV